MLLPAILRYQQCHKLVFFFVIQSGLKIQIFISRFQIVEIRQNDKMSVKEIDGIKIYM